MVIKALGNPNNCKLNKFEPQNTIKCNKVTGFMFNIIFR